MRRPALLLGVVLCLLAAACGDDGGGEASGGDPSPTTQAGAAPPTTSAGPPTTLGELPATQVDAVVYLSRDGTVATAGRAVGAPAVARAAVEALLAGPTAFEEELGISSAIPGGTRLLDLALGEGLATVSLSGAFLDDLGEDTALRVAQVVFTLTQFPSVERVTLLIEGIATASVGFDAVPVVEVDRGDFEAVTPAVLVESPTPGQAVAGPVVVTGIANTFEANVGYEVSDAVGAVLDAGFTTATAGTGTWGDFAIPLDVEPGDVLITVFQPSGEDGSPRDRYPVPVTVT